MHTSAVAHCLGGLGPRFLVHATIPIDDQSRHLAWVVGFMFVDFFFVRRMQDIQQSFPSCPSGVAYLMNISLCAAASDLSIVMWAIAHLKLKVDG